MGHELIDIEGYVMRNYVVNEHFHVFEGVYVYSRQVAAYILMNNNLHHIKTSISKTLGAAGSHDGKILHVENSAENPRTFS